MFSWSSWFSGSKPLRLGHEDWSIPEPPQLPQLPAAPPTRLELLFLGLNTGNFQVLKLNLLRFFAGLVSGTDHEKEEFAEDACGSKYNLSFTELESLVVHLLDNWKSLPRRDIGLLLATLVQVVRTVDTYDHDKLMAGFVIVDRDTTTMPAAQKANKSLIEIHMENILGSTVQEHRLHYVDIAFQHDGKFQHISISPALGQDTVMRLTDVLHLTWFELLEFVVGLTSLPLEGRNSIAQNVLAVMWDYVVRNGVGVDHLTFQNCNVQTVGLLGSCVPRNDRRDLVFGVGPGFKQVTIEIDHDEESLTGYLEAAFAAANPCPNAASKLNQRLGGFSSTHGQRTVKVGRFEHTVVQLCALFSHLFACLREQKVLGTEPRIDEVSTYTKLFLKALFCIARALDACADAGDDDSNDDDDKKGVETVEIIPSEAFLNMGVSLARLDYLKVECQVSSGKLMNVSIGILGMVRLN